MLGQRIERKYLEKLINFFEEHSLEDFQVIYDNEQKFSDYLEVNTFKFVNSGTSALYLILNYIKSISATGFRELKVVGPSFSHISWINCCNWLDIQYDFLDVKEDTLSLNPDKLQEMIDDMNCPDVVVMVDMGGYIGEDTIKIKHICDKYNIILIEDSAHAFGQEYKGYKSGTIGDYGFYSFSNPKLLTCGEGGAIVSKHHDLNLIFEEYIYQGGWYRYEKKDYKNGLNFIMSNWMTELLGYQLDNIDEIKLKHELKFVEYNEKTPLWVNHSTPSFFAYRKENIHKMILENKLPSLLYQRYKSMGDVGKFPVSELLMKELLYWKY